MITERGRTVHFLEEDSREHHETKQGEGTGMTSTGLWKDYDQYSWRDVEEGVFSF